MTAPRRGAQQHEHSRLNLGHPIRCASSSDGARRDFGLRLAPNGGLEPKGHRSSHFDVKRDRDWRSAAAESRSRLEASLNLVVPTRMDVSTARRTTWTVTQDAFECFLRYLDPDRHRAGTEYEQIRERL